MTRRNGLIGVVLALSLTTAAPCWSALVVTIDGGLLRVASYEVEGEWVRLHLLGRGLLIMPLARIERVVDDDGQAIDLSDPPTMAGLQFGDRERVPQTPFGDLIFSTARRFRVSPTLVAAIVRAESAFNPRAVSPKGARGLMQLMPATASRFGISSDRLFEPAANLEAGTRYLAWLIERFPGDLARVLAAYNAGELNVDRHGGVPPFRETREYIGRVYEFLGAVR